MKRSCQTVTKTTRTVMDDIGTQILVTVNVRQFSSSEASRQSLRLSQRRCRGMHRPSPQANCSLVQPGGRQPAQSQALAVEKSGYIFISQSQKLAAEIRFYFISQSQALAVKTRFSFHLAIASIIALSATINILSSTEKIKY